MNTVYVSDLDGTLLRDDATLSEFSRNTLVDLLCEGLPFTAASARSVVSIQPILSGLRLSLPIVEFNGAFITELGTGHHVAINSIDRAVVEEVYRIIRDFRCVPFISSFNGSEDCVYYRDILNDGMRWYLNDRVSSRDRRLRPVEDLTDAFRDQVVCITVIDRAEVLSEIRNRVAETCGNRVVMYCYENSYSPGWHWLTVSDRRATKDRAIRGLLDLCGLGEAELVVFGDNLNDVEMFREADRCCRPG